MVFYYENKRPRIDSYLKINKWFNSQNKKLKTKKVKLIVLVNGFYRILYRIILFINMCKRISKNFTILQIKMEAEQEIFWSRYDSVSLPTFYKRKRNFKKHLNNLNKYNKFKKANTTKTRLYPNREEIATQFRIRKLYKNKKKRLTTYMFYIFRKRMNVVYESKKKELSRYIRKRGIRKLLKRKAVLVWFMRRIKRMYRTYDLRYFNGERMNRRFFRTRIFRRKKKRYFLQINRNRTIRRLLKYLNKYMYFKKEKKKPTLLSRKKYFRRGRKKKKAISIGFFFQKNPTIWYTNVEFNFFLKSFYGFNLDFYKKAESSILSSYNINGFFDLIDRSLDFTINSNFWVRLSDQLNLYLNGEIITDFSDINSVGSLKLVSIGDFIERRSTISSNISDILTNDMVLLFNVVYTLRNTDLIDLKKSMLKIMYMEGHKFSKLELLSKNYNNVFKRFKRKRFIRHCPFFEFKSIFYIYNQYQYQMFRRPSNYRDKSKLLDNVVHKNLSQIRKKNIFFFLFKKHLLSISQITLCSKKNNRSSFDRHTRSNGLLTNCEFTSLFIGFDSGNYNYFKKFYFQG